MSEQKTSDTPGPGGIIETPYAAFLVTVGGAVRPAHPAGDRRARDRSPIEELLHGSKDGVELDVLVSVFRKSAR